MSFGVPFLEKLKISLIPIEEMRHELFKHTIRVLTDSLIKKKASGRTLKWRRLIYFVMKIFIFFEKT
ncbi:hypothetical protein CPK_ORF00671 [Chlamydia pneumoniae LPCoLN]|nr:hypothetical protein CPK_ORF00671 [Chlamydia pneumoniae LPCoLN]ETR80055.1 hypothetical protein X556_0632 [Chlamydia pneumoniae B21]